MNLSDLKLLHFRDFGTHSSPQKVIAFFAQKTCSTPGKVVLKRKRRFRAFQNFRPIQNPLRCEEVGRSWKKMKHIFFQVKKNRDGNFSNEILCKSKSWEKIEKIEKIEKSMLQRIPSNKTKKSRSGKKSKTIEIRPISPERCFAFCGSTVLGNCLPGS